MNHQYPVYFDNNSTTPLDPRAFQAMVPYFSDRFGNAASRSHKVGWIAQEAVEHARMQVAKLINAHASEIVWTSGATEADNLAIKGVVRAVGMTDADKVLLDALAIGKKTGAIANAEEILPSRVGAVSLDAIAERGAFNIFRMKRDHVVTVATEHKAVLDSVMRLKQEGFRVTCIGVNGDGLLDLDRLEEAITERTIIVSVMMANNETGVLQPVEEIGRICRGRDVIFHSDATQAAGKVSINVRTMKIDLLSLSAHKMYGPKGVGALFVRSGSSRIHIEPLLHGGGHERGRRSGTLNVPGIVGMGAAAELCTHEMDEEALRLTEYRNRFLGALCQNLDGVVVNGSQHHCLPGTLNVSFAGVNSDALIVAMKDVAAATGAACSSESVTPSHVLQALGVSSDRLRSSIRFSMGRFTTAEEVERVGESVIRAVKDLRMLKTEAASSAHDADPALSK